MTWGISVAQRGPSVRLLARKACGARVKARTINTTRGLTLPPVLCSALRLGLLTARQRPPPPTYPGKSAVSRWIKDCAQWCLTWPARRDTSHPSSLPFTRPQIHAPQKTAFPRTTFCAKGLLSVRTEPLELTSGPDPFSKDSQFVTICSVSCHHLRYLPRSSPAALLLSRKHTSSVAIWSATLVTHRD